jgi:uncharacterized membrane protein
MYAPEMVAAQCSMRPNDYELSVCMPFFSAYCIQLDLREGTVYCAVTHQDTAEVRWDIRPDFSQLVSAAFHADDIKG